MSSAHLHLVLNHVPLFGLLFGGGVLLYAVARASDVAARIALVFFVVSGLAAAGTYLTGEEAEEIVEGLSRVTHVAIEAHEEVAIFALVSTATLAFLSLVFLFWYRGRSIPRVVGVVLLAVTFVSIATVGYTAYTGGQINHPELRGETTAAFVPAQSKFTEDVCEQPTVHSLRGRALAAEGV